MRVTHKPPHQQPFPIHIFGCTDVGSAGRSASGQVGGFDDQLFAASPFISGTGKTVLGKETLNTM